MKILIAEDTRDMNRVLTVALEHEGYTVDSAFDGEQALDLILKNGYDGIVLDIMMPKKDGIEVLTQMRLNHVFTPVLLLTAKTEIDDRVAGLDAGADDYLTKPFAMKELMARVRALVRRKGEYAAENISFMDLKLDSGSGELSCENSVRLSVKELELLQLLIKNAGQKMQPDFFLKNVWSDTPGATKETVWLYIRYLRSKLQAISSSVEILGERDEFYYLEKQA